MSRILKIYEKCEQSFWIVQHLEGKAKISAGQTWENVCAFYHDTKVENKFSWGESMWHEITVGVEMADRTKVPVKN